ncbi:MAG: hypothetical protein M3Y09_16705 [Actinomycetota bacterium]|nr:hypothetical protein [Actinomycetota bacterium]
MRLLLAIVSVAALVTGCGGSSARPPTARRAHASSTVSTHPGPGQHRAGSTPSAASPPLRGPLRITVHAGARRAGTFSWRPAVSIRRQTAIWISRVAAEHLPGDTVTLLRLDSRLVTLALHAGASEPGGRGWRYGDAIRGAERGRVLAAFNSAFREGYGAGGFAADGRIGWRLRRRAASVVVYRDGGVNIGRWRVSVPTPGRPTAFVRQNLGLLIDRGQIASTVDTCIKRCWGDPLHEQPIVARSGLGITRRGELVWAAGYSLSVRALAQALARAGAVRAMELDINPHWVAGYLYVHGRRTAVVPLPLVPGQAGIAGQFLTPYFRDFFSVLPRRPAPGRAG